MYVSFMNLVNSCFYELKKLSEAKCLRIRAQKVRRETVAAIARPVAPTRLDIADYRSTVKLMPVPSF